MTIAGHGEREPAVLRGCVIEARWAGERTDPGDLCANTQMVAIALMRSCVAVVCSEDFQIAAAGVYEGPVTDVANGGVSDRFGA